MDKRKIVRLELVGLAIVTFVLLYRAISGPPAPDGLVVFTELKPRQLRHAAFILDQPAELTVRATGSVAQQGAVEALAAYSWVVRRGDRALAWQMHPGEVMEEAGTLVTVEDTLRLQAGTYDVYFAAYGNVLDGRADRRQHRDEDERWVADAKHWLFVLRVPEGDEAVVEQVPEEEARARAPSFEGLVWTTAPMGSNAQREQLLEVRQPLRARVYAVGELYQGPDDYGWIEQVPSGRRVWEMTQDNTTPAGGVDANRSFDGTVMLQPGLYRVAFQTDRTHAFGDWRGNPPYDPAAWGLTLSAADPAGANAVSAFDPWTSRRPIVQLTKVPDDALQSGQFAVDEPLDVLVYAVGELSEGSLYDYAWIENNDTKEPVWKMSWDASQPAGGDEDNRIETAFLHLNPGAYTVYFQTDGSHAYGDWRKEEPDYPERWGVTLFPLSDSPGLSAVRLLGPVPSSVAGVEVPPQPLPPGLEEKVLGQTRLGNRARVHLPFQVDRPTRFHIQALGEISYSGRYDYGWIERADTGSIVWEMSWQNTEPAGGDDKNRRFEGDITLAPGRYILHYRTDASYAFGDFGDQAPDTPDAWGITIERLP